MSVGIAPNFAAAALAAASAFLCASSAAAGIDDSLFSFAGFGTLGLTHSSEHAADFTPSYFKPSGAGFSRDWSFAVDSLVAAQVTANITPQLSAVVQAVAQQNYNDTYWPHIEWADVKYLVTPDFSVRVGRTVLPTFLVSDTRNVGYATPWLRPPVEVYGLNPITSSDGADVSYKLTLGRVQNTVVAAYGNRNYDIPHDGSIKARRDWIIADTAEFGAATLHIAYQRADLSVPYLGPLFDAFREFGTRGNALANRYDIQNKTATFYGVGAMYDPANWFVTAEWGRTDLDSVLGRTTGWYVSGGYRVTKFSPYVTYAHATANNLSDPGLSVTGLAPAAAGEAVALNAALNSILSTKRVQSTISAGVRWDILQNTDFKLQFDHTRIGAGTSSEMINTQPGFRPGARVNLISVVVDFVF